MEDDEYEIDISTMTTSGTITIDTTTLSSSYDIDWGTSIDIDSITIYQPVEFEDQMPSVAKVEDMCKEYPALEKAYENFKTVYKLVRQDWQGKQDQDDDGQLHF